MSTLASQRQTEASMKVRLISLHRRDPDGSEWWTAKRNDTGEAIIVLLGGDLE